MRRIAILFGFAALGAMGFSTANACSCHWSSLVDLYENANHVAMGEVVSAELVSQTPTHGERADYVATLRILERYKGRSKRNVRVGFNDRYEDPSRKLANTNIQPEVVVVNSCHAAMHVGERWVIFEKRGEPLELSGLCTERIRLASQLNRETMLALEKEANKSLERTRGR